MNQQKPQTLNISKGAESEDSKPKLSTPFQSVEGQCVPDSPFLQQSQIENFQPKSTKQKKKQRKKRSKQKANLESKSEKELDLIILSIYQNGGCFQDHQQKIQQIAPYITRQDIFIRTLNRVIISYVQSSIATLNTNISKFLENEDKQDKRLWIECLAESEVLYKMIIDFLYESYLDIERAGEQISKVLGVLKSSFSEERYKLTYQSLNKNVLRYLIYDHQDLKMFIKHSYKIYKPSARKFMKLEDQNFRRLDRIIDVLSPSEENQGDSEALEPEEDDSDDSILEEEIKSKKKKRNKKKKNKDKNNDSVESQEIKLIVENPESTVFKLIEKLNKQDPRMAVKMSKQFLAKFSPNN